MTEQRSNWSISQAVDDVILSLRVGSISHADAGRRMTGRMVPPEVQKRVLAGHAVLRHRRLPGEQIQHRTLANG